jgi:hypothetical protein
MKRFKKNTPAPSATEKKRLFRGMLVQTVFMLEVLAIIKKATTVLNSHRFDNVPQQDQ